VIVTVAVWLFRSRPGIALIQEARSSVVNGAGQEDVAASVYLRS